MPWRLPLAIAPEARPQTVQAFQSALTEAALPASPPTSPPATPPASPRGHVTDSVTGRSPILPQLRPRAGRSRPSGSCSQRCGGLRDTRIGAPAGGPLADSGNRGAMAPADGGRVGVCRVSGDDDPLQHRQLHHDQPGQLRRKLQLQRLRCQDRRLRGPDSKGGRAIRRTPGGSMTCMATFVNGWKIVITTATRARPRMAAPGSTAPIRSGCYAAAPGTSTPGTSARPIALGVALPPGAMTLVFALPER